MPSHITYKDTFNHETNQQQRVIKLVGDLDFSLYQAFQHTHQPDDLAAHRVESLVIDFSETLYIDSSALAMLAQAQEAVRNQGIRFHLINRPQAVEKLLHMSGFLSQL